MDLEERKKAGLPIVANATPVETQVPEPTAKAEPAKQPEVGVPTIKLDPDPTMVIPAEKANEIREAIAQAKAQEAPTEKLKP